MRRFGVSSGVVRVAQVGAALALAFTVANCGRSGVDPKYGVSASRRVVDPGEEVPKGGGTYRVGKPYQVAGRTYIPEENPNYDAEGVASWYGQEFHGRLTANGEVFDMNSVSAAHPTLPIPSYVRVTNLRNRKSLIVRVNDRGPFHENRVIDVSVRAAKLLDFHRYGVTRVRVEYVGRAALGGSDDDKLASTLRAGAPAAFPTTRVASAQAPVRSYRHDQPEQRTAARAEPNVREIHTATRMPETTGRGAGPAYTVASDRSQPAPIPRTAAAPEAPSSFDSRFGWGGGAAVLRNEPASAFAPRFDSVVTGRGLY